MPKLTLCQIFIYFCDQVRWSRVSVRPSSGAAPTVSASTLRSAATESTNVSTAPTSTTAVSGKYALGGRHCLTLEEIFLHFLKSPEFED